MERAKRVASVGVLVIGLLVRVAGAAAQMGEAAAVPVKLESVLGRDVTTMPEGDAGRIIDLLVDRDGSVRAAVVEFGGFLGIGTRKIAIEWQAFRFSGRAIAVEVSREQVRAAPEYKSRDVPPVVKATSE
jgi:predicted O-methyltransferase YrrM